MMTIRSIAGLVLTVCAALTASACDTSQEPAAVDNMAISNIVENAAPADVADTDNVQEVSNTGSSTKGEAGASSLPTAFLGRWGMTEADCDLSRSDTKGLVEISDDRLEFYESVGQLTKATAMSPIEVNASFAFSGEGQSWNKDMTLKLEDGGSTLVRIENNPATRFRHKKCA